MTPRWSIRSAALIFAALAMISDVRGQANWAIPKADAERWANQIRALTPTGWTVSIAGNDIIVQRDQPVTFLQLVINGSGDNSGRIRGAGRDGIFRYTLKFGPKLSMEEYEKRAAANILSDQEKDRLTRGINDISHKFDQYISANPQEQKRLEAYNDAVAKLPRSDLPDLYCVDYSIRIFSSNDGWSVVSDHNNAGIECEQIKDSLLRLFGMYDPKNALDPHNLVRPESSQR